MLNKSKLYSAKQKISQLKEKYSTKISKNKEMQKIHFTDSDLETKKVLEKLSSSENEINQTMGDKSQIIDIYFDMEHLDKKTTEISKPKGESIISITSISVEGSIEEVSDELSANTTVNSNSSNQLENICLVSSSSKSSSITKAFSFQKQLTHDSSVHTEVLSESSNILPKSENAETYHEELKIIHNSNETDSVASSIRYSEFGSDIYKKDKILYVMDKTTTKHKHDINPSDNGFVKSSSEISLQFNNKYLNNDGIVDFVLESDCLNLPEKSPDKSQELPTTRKNNIYLTKQTPDKLLLLDDSKIFDGHVTEMNNTLNNSASFTSTDVSIIFKTNKIEQNNILGGKPKTFLNARKNKKPIIKADINIEPSKKRPMIKSCKLIQFNQRNRVEYEELTQKTSNISNINFIPDIVLNDQTKGNNSYDEEIRNILRRQIQLTRYFIESHHQMYLYCCQAVKTLNNSYVNNNGNLFQ